jgi:hypothetical protein
MTQALEEKIFQSYPKLFPNRDNLQVSCMGFGFECGDGWFPLIDTLCHTIQNYVDNNSKPQPIVVQVKEKLGTLRFYADNTDRLIDGMIWLAEAISARTCEVCGQPGKLNTEGWHTVRCEACNSKE